MVFFPDNDVNINVVFGLLLALKGIIFYASIFGFHISSERAIASLPRCLRDLPLTVFFSLSICSFAPQYFKICHDISIYTLFGHIKTY